MDNTQDSDFPGVAYFVFKSRMKPKSEDITVGDINGMLDTIAAAEVGMKACKLLYLQDMILLIEKLIFDKIKLI